jgi:hypothetical protein
MLYDVEEDVRRQAKSPHELFMLNLAMFHLLMAPAAIVLRVGTLGFLVPLGASLAVIGFTYLRSRRAEARSPWFVAAHWRLAARRSRILLAVYVASGAIVGTGFLLSLSIDKKTMQDIMITVFSRIAVVPVLIVVMVCFVLESGAIYQAGRGEVPDALLAHLPPPATESQP